MSKHQFVVLGLGSFGETVAVELARLGNDVLGVDQDERKVDDLANAITHAAVADVTDEKALRELDVGNYDAAVVAIGENIEASILATLHLKSIGIKEIWVKAFSNQHHRILAKIGATRIIHPEHEMGLRVAQILNYPVIDNYMDVGDNEYIVEIIASEKLNNRQISELIAEADASVTVLLVRRGHHNHHLPKIAPETMMISTRDRIVLLGQRAELKKVARYL